MTAASESSVPHPADMKWYYLHEGVQVGPISEEILLDAARRSQIQPTTLVWQQAFDRWKEAASVPMIAVNLGRCAEPLQTDPTALPRVVEPTQEPFQESPVSRATQPFAEPPADEPLAPHNLDNAVADDEASDPTMDVQQVREIPKRTSRYPSERSIPPASTASHPAPARDQASKPVSVSRLIGFAAISLLLATVVVVLITRQPQGLAEATASTAKAASNDLAKEPTPRVETRKDTAPQDERRAAAIPTAESTVPPERAEAGASERQPNLVRITSGPLDVRLFLSKLQRALPMFDEQCWDKLRASVGEGTNNPSVRIDMSVDRWGYVYDVESSKAPPGYLGAGRCIIGRMRGWRFPKAEQGTQVVMNIARVRD